MSHFGTERTSPRGQLISAFRGKADIDWMKPPCPLLTQSGHEQLGIAAVQTHPRPPFRRPQIPAVIASFHSIARAALSLGGGQCDDAIS